MSLTPRGMSIQEAYRLFADGKLLVNRRYQRKLVWSENEKRRLIDSVQKDFPIPLFMFAKIDGQDSSLEVIDGMQRLNAIFSFIEHRFKDENGQCFDIDQNPRARIQKESGSFSVFPDNIPRLSDKQCASFLEYQLAVTVDGSADTARINEVFGRINSSGRRLSPQEQRQAGLVSGLSEFVRRLSMEMRGDDSPDVLPLNQMPSVSFNTPKERQGYGVDANEIFWCKHGIITPGDLARAEDEQIIADISISILNSEPLNSSREVLDDYFNSITENFQQIEQKLSSYRNDRLQNEIKTVIGNIRAIFEQDTFLSIRNCVQDKPSSTARTAFYALFFAFFDLIVKLNMKPENFGRIRTSLKNSQLSLTMSAHHTTTDDRTRNIGKMKGLIQDYFVKSDVPVIGHGHALAIDIENSLRRSRFESSRYEFKIGCCTLEDKPKLNQEMYAKLARTAAAIANSSPESDGYIYIGVADKKDAADRITNVHGGSQFQIGSVYFVGIGHDLKFLNINVEDYVKRLIREIQKTPLGDPLKTQLITGIDHAEYKGLPFIRIRVPRQSELTAYAGDFPIRKNSDTVDMSALETLAQSKLFRNLG